MSNIIGLDFGTKTIGWAIIDNSSKATIDSGVRVFQRSLKNDRRIVRQKRRAVIKIDQTNFIKQIRDLLKRTNPIIFTLCFSSLLTALMIFFNFCNWQFWFNSFLTIFIAMLTLIYSDVKK